MNYVAQPGDNAYLMPKFGPYDYFAIDWGYRQFTETVVKDGKKVVRVLSSDAEWPSWTSWRRRQVDEPDAALRRRGRLRPRSTPRSTPTSSAATASSAADLGLRNIDRVVPMLIPATTKLGGSYEQLREMWDALVMQRHRELDAVAKLVGGVEETRYQAGRGDAAVQAGARGPAARRREVPDRARLHHAEGDARSARCCSASRRPARPTALQDSNQKLLQRLIDAGVFQRMAEAQALAPGTKGYTGLNMLYDLNDGLFSELRCAGAAHRSVSSRTAARLRQAAGAEGRGRPQRVSRGPAAGRERPAGEDQPGDQEGEESDCGASVRSFRGAGARALEAAAGQLPLSNAILPLPAARCSRTQSATTMRTETSDFSTLLECLSGRLPALRRALLGLESDLDMVERSAGERLLTKGETANAVYVIAAGTLRAVAIREDGSELTLSEFGPGELAGEMAILTGGGVYSASVLAAADCVLVRVPRTSFEHIIKTLPQVVQELSEGVRRRIARDQLAKGLTRLFGPLQEAVLRYVESRVQWVRLQAGEVLFSEGDSGRDLYFVLGGRLRAMAGERVLNEMSRGESIGEIALLTGERRTATVVAVRDSELVRISRETFEEIVEKYPKVMHVIAGIVVQRLIAKERAVRPQAMGMCIAVLGIGGAQSTAELTEPLIKALGDIGPTLHLSAERVDTLLNQPGIAGADKDHVAGIRLTAWLDEQESGYRFIVYQADTTATGWTLRCLRQADEILLVAGAGSSPDPTPAEKTLLSRGGAVSKARQTLVLLHPDGTPAACRDRTLVSRPRHPAPLPHSPGRAGRLCPGGALSRRPCRWRGVRGRRRPRPRPHRRHSRSA